MRLLPLIRAQAGILGLLKDIHLAVTPATRHLEHSILATLLSGTIALPSPLKLRRSKKLLGLQWARANFRVVVLNLCCHLNAAVRILHYTVLCSLRDLRCKFWRPSRWMGSLFARLAIPLDIFLRMRETLYLSLAKDFEKAPGMHEGFVVSQPCKAVGCHSLLKASIHCNERYSVADETSTL